MNDQQMSCAIHDYLETACVFGIRIRLWLDDGSVAEGIPRTTETRPDKSEWLYMTQESTEIEIPLNRIVRFSALTENKYFSEVTVR